MYVAYHMTADSTKFGGDGYQICVLFYSDAYCIVYYNYSFSADYYVRAWAQVLISIKK
jgi:hypothetical protein